MRPAVPPKWRIRARHTIARALRALAVLIAGTVALLGCAWVKDTFGDPPGPIRCDPDQCASVGQCQGSVCVPYDAFPSMGTARDAGVG